MLNLLCDLLFVSVSAPVAMACVANVQEDGDVEDVYDESHENGGYGPSYGPQ